MPVKSEQFSPLQIFAGFTWLRFAERAGILDNRQGHCTNVRQGIHLGPSTMGGTFRDIGVSKLLFRPSTFAGHAYRSRFDRHRSLSSVGYTADGDFQLMRYLLRADRPHMTSAEGKTFAHRAKRDGTPFSFGQSTKPKKMATTSQIPRVVEASRMRGDVVISFADGRSAVYSAALLSAIFSQADELIEGLNDQDEISDDLSSETATP